MAGDIAGRQGWSPPGVRDDAALAPALTVLRLGLDLLAEAAGYLTDHDLNRLRSVVSTATDQVERRAALVLDGATGHSAA